jgi:16S rRNA (cytosine967-C5)-methyltransferase
VEPESISVNTLVEARRNTFKKAKADPVRLLVFDVMTEVNRRDGYSNLLLPKALEDSSFDQR